MTQLGRVSTDSHDIYNEVDIAGTSLPLLQAKPPSRGQRCAAITAIVVTAILAVIISIVSYGAASAAAAAATAAVASSVSAGLAAGAVAGALVGAAIAVAGAFVQRLISWGLGKNWAEGDAKDFWNDDFGRELGRATLGGAFSGAAGGFASSLGYLAKAGQVGKTLAWSAKIGRSVFTAVGAYATQGIYNEGKVKSWTGIGAAALGGYAGAEGALTGARLRTPGVDDIGTVQGGTLQLFGKTAPLGNVNTLSGIISPWASLIERKRYESKHHEGQPYEALEIANAVNQSLGTLAGATLLRGLPTKTFADRIEATTLRALPTVGVGTALAVFDPTGNHSATKQYFTGLLGSLSGAIGGAWVGDQIVGRIETKQKERLHEREIRRTYKGFTPMEEGGSQIKSRWVYTTVLGAGQEVPFRAPQVTVLGPATFGMQTQSAQRRDAAQWDVHIGEAVILDEYDNPTPPPAPISDETRNLQLGGDADLYMTPADPASSDSAESPLEPVEENVRPVYPHDMYLQPIVSAVQPVVSAYDTVSGWLSAIAEGPVLDAEETLAQVSDAAKYALSYPVHALNAAAISARARGPVDAMAAARAAYQPEYSSEIAQRLEQGESPAILLPNVVTHIPVVGAPVGVGLGVYGAYSAASQGDWRTVHHMTGSLLVGGMLGMAVSRGSKGGGFDPSGPLPKARVEGLAGAPAREFVDLLRDTKPEIEHGIGGIMSTKYEYGTPGAHHISARVRGDTLEFSNIDALDPALRSRGVKGRDLVLSLVKRLHSDGANIRNVDFAFSGSLRLKGISTNFDELYENLKPFRDAGKTPDQAALAQAILGTRSGSVAATLGFQVSAAKMTTPTVVLGTFTRPHNAPQLRFTVLDDQ